MERKRTFINLAASIVSFAINIGINFFLTPFIVNKLGHEAYGFIGLANNFVNYITVITVALNSVAGRFITIKIHQKDERSANIYFNSVLISNAIMASVLSIVSLITIINLQHIVNIPDYLVGDVKITFALVFLNFAVTIITTIFNIATFVRNRLELSSIATIAANVVRALILVALFYFFDAKLFYISISALAMTMIVAACNARYTKMLLSEIKIKASDFSFKAVKELISIGIWNSVNNLSQILLNGLDLLIANLFISASSMGMLSIAKSIPTIIISFLSTIGAVFSPKFTILYAQKKMDELIQEINLSIKILGLIVTVPLAGFMVFGIDFYRLWLPKMSEGEIMQIQILSVLTIGQAFISAFVYSLYNINVITNKLKVPVLVTLVISLISTGTVVMLLKTTDLGVYAIAGVSSLLMTFRVLFFVPVYAAYSLEVKYTTFYPPMIKGIISSVIISSVFYIGHRFVSINSWVEFVFIAGGFAVIGYAINLFVIGTKQEREIVIGKFINKFGIKLSKECN